MTTATKAINDILTDDQFWLQQRAEMLGVSVAVFRELYIQAAQAIAETRDVSFDFEAINTAAERFIAAYADTWWAELEATTREALRDAILTAEREGLGVDYVLKTIEPYFGPERAMRIAVTETTRLMGEGAQEQMRQAGVGLWDWDTVMDAEVCDLCQEMADGGPYPMEQQFEPAHPNCRCGPAPRGE